MSRPEIATPPNAVRATADLSPYPKLLFATVSLALFMSSIDQTIVATALHAIDSDLQASLNWGGWTITIYATGRMVVTPIVGRLGERFGPRSIFVWSVGIFTLASLACGAATSIGMLIALRAVQAVGGAAFMPSATGLVSDHFGSNRDRAIGLFSSILPIGAILGPVFGGYFVEYWSWRAIFWVNVPLGLVVVAAAFAVLPPGGRRSGARVDLAGTLYLCSGLLALTLAFTWLGDGGHSPVDAVFIGLVTLSALAGWLVLRRSSLPEAVLPISLLRGRGFGVMHVINLVFGSVAMGLSALVSLYAQNRYGLDTLQSGTVLTARGIGMICVSGLATFALRRTGYRAPMAVGFTVTSCGLVVLALAPRWHLGAHAWLTLATLVVGVGMGLAMPATNNASIQLAPERAASISGLRTTFRQLGAITAISITTAILSRSGDPGHAQAVEFVVFAILLAGVLPLVRLVPEHRDAW